MKLIRLTSDSNDGRFDNNFNDEIIIEPKSKVALQSLAVRSDIGSLRIDDNNHDVQFEVVSGNTRTVTLNNFTYDENDNHKFLNDLQLKLNQGLFYTDQQSATAFKDEIGFQFKVAVGTAGQCQVQMANTRYGYSSVDAISEVFTELVDGEVEFTRSSPPKIASSTANANEARADEKHSIYGVKPFTTGCGVFRVKLSTWTNDSSPNASVGFEMGLCDSKPDTWTTSANRTSIPETKKTFAIRGFQPTSNFSVKTSNDTDFALATNQNGANVAPDETNGADADIIEISVQGPNIVCTVFRISETAGDILFTEPYEVDANGVPVPLFAYLTFHSSRANFEIVDMKFCPDAYLEPRPSALVDEVETFGSGARPNASRTGNTIKKIDFRTESVASFLGFNNIVNISPSGRSHIFTADDLFKALIENECYIILLENIQLDSYDGLKQGRKSILASVPNPSNGDRVIYEPNTNNYIELNNANTISLRNIRARILYQDYTPVDTLGLSVLSLLVANQTE